MGFMDKLKSGAEQLKEASGQAAERAKIEVAELKVKREVNAEYDVLGEKAYALADSGAISHPDLNASVEKIRKLKAELDELAKQEAAIGTEEEPAAAAATPPSEQPPA
jgi:hypothetical protein